MLFKGSLKAQTKVATQQDTLFSKTQHVHDSRALSQKRHNLPDERGQQEESLFLGGEGGKPSPPKPKKAKPHRQGSSESMPREASSSGRQQSHATPNSIKQKSHLKYFFTDGPDEFSGLDGRFTQTSTTVRRQIVDHPARESPVERTQVWAQHTGSHQSRKQQPKQNVLNQKVRNQQQASSVATTAHNRSAGHTRKVTASYLLEPQVRSGTHSEKRSAKRLNKS